LLFSLVLSFFIFILFSNCRWTLSKTSRSTCLKISCAFEMYVSILITFYCYCLLDFLFLTL
jgi:hypothetical protein